MIRIPVRSLRERVFFENGDKNLTLSIVGTLRDYDGDGNGNVYNTIGFMSKTTTHASRTLFCTFLCRPYTTTTWSDQILSWLRTGTARREKFDSFSYNLNSYLSGNWVTWYKGEKVSKVAKLFFIGVPNIRVPVNEDVRYIIILT